MSKKIISHNKQARFHYHVDDTIECGIILLGTEVKSIKEGNISFSDAYAFIRKEKLIIHNMHIPEYSFGNIQNHKVLRERELLIHKRERVQLVKKTKEKGFTLIPLSCYVINGLIKIEIGICKGKKLYDKRNSLKKKTIERDVAREVRRRFK